MNKVISSIILCACMLNTACAYQTEVLINGFYYRSDGKSEPTGYQFSNGGRFRQDGSDVMSDFRICAKSASYYCIFTSNRNVIFSLPKINPVIGDEWTFGGMKFRVLTTSKIREDLVVGLSARPTEKFRKHLKDNGYNLEVINFLYSEKIGLVSFSRYFDRGNPTFLVDTWIFPFGFDISRYEVFKSDAVLSEEELQRLLQGGFDL